MNLSKGGESSAEGRPEPPGSGAAPSRSLIGRFALLGSVLALGAAIVLGAQLSARWRERSLDEARAELSALLHVTDPAERMARASSVARTLDSYLARRSKRPDTARALLAAALSASAPSPRIDRLVRQCDVSRLDSESIRVAAHLFFQSGSFALADRFVELALERGDNREAVLRLAALVRYDLGREEDVLNHCRELAELVPEDFRPWMVVGQIYRDRSLWLQAVEPFEEAVRRAPDDAAVHWLLLDCQIQSGDAEAARRHFDRLRGTADLSSPPPPFVRDVVEARLLQLEGKLDDAQKLIEKELTSSPNDLDALLLLGRLRLARGEWKEAVDPLERLLELDPVSHEGHYALGQTLARLGRADEARKQFELQKRITAVKSQLYSLERRAGRNPNDVETRREISRQYRTLGLEKLAEFWERSADAAEASRSSVQAAPSSEQPAF